mmetsp:Transcript_18037/g.26794  ORF Transcript_18037/g.26794 Transcript_18037/m.26794 type:complete len:80 (-) Transcript_18037:110-349(-)
MISAALLTSIHLSSATKDNEILAISYLPASYALVLHFQLTVPLLSYETTVNPLLQPLALTVQIKSKVLCPEVVFSYNEH